ncbi:SLBB domain-containing protein [Pedobacter metabolipauper]|uniref:Protein involved in polysaccharide export with SLBB domain n=1 Tax=Pedobacter metabolipauper TaxID=425513 RepID=A0A4R6SXK2_9SPHI|nr:SLBB domain-containing protein [Pedobacter metabolipauper]TDQ09903.1 protein involved in polysaccharide export with SLBB domain [Pedobacter metabolipauper]
MNYKRIIAVCSFLISMIICGTAYAQNTNYADAKVDDLTDAQIRQMMDRAESIGYSDAQLEQLAAAQGMKAAEVLKLRQRVEKIRKQDGTSKDNSKTGSASQNTRTTAVEQDRSRGYTGRDQQQDTTRRTNNQNLDPDKKALEEEKKKEIERIFEGIKPKIFGEDLFKKENMTFEPNFRMATPKSYVIGPDDELLIDLTGDNEGEYKAKVSPDGNIRVEYVGLIAVSGLTIENATAKIKNIMSRTYPGLKNGRNDLSVTLGNIRSIKIIVVGEVVKPGTYTVPSLYTVFNVMDESGGPNKNGSYRKIQVIRNNKIVSTLDIYDFLLNGIQKNNIGLRDQDVINVPVYESRVEMSGEVKRPALFEVLSTENFSDLVRFAGGFTNSAYSAQVKVLQNTGKERKITDVFAADYSKFTPANGDKYVIEPILDRFENRVEITGAVFRPGQYELDKGLTLKQLITKAEGLTEDAFLNRAYISRLNADNSPAMLSFDVAKIIAGTEPDIILQREDKITISSIFDLRDEYKVTIQGEVRYPGTFEYADNMNLEALIQIAGGFKEGATPSRIEISRRIKNSDATSASALTAEVFTVKVDQELRILQSGFVLKPFDIVSIRSSETYQVQRQIKVEGEVLYPGTYTITKKDERISDIIVRAGGLSPLAYADGASLKRTGGRAAKVADSLEKAQEEREKLVNLRRLKQSGAKDTTSIEQDIQILRSDLVGIDLVRILKKPLSRQDLIVEDGDVIRVPKELQTVRVTGEVLKPNSIVYLKGKSFRNYIDGAGGFSYNAYKKGANIVYSNGSVAAAKKFLFFNNYPQVKPGAEIFVPKRAEREGMTTQAIVGITTGIASLAAIVLSLFR